MDASLGADSSTVNVPFEFDAALVPDASDALDATGPDAAIADASEAADGAPHPDADADGALGSCSLKGAFSGAVDFDVEWKGTTVAGFIPVVAPGKGTIRIVVRLDFEDDGGGVTRAKLKPCLGDQPDFEGSWLVGEVYSAYIPDKAWDQPTMPVMDMTWQVQCLTPGCMMNAKQVVATLGARNAPDDVWPGRDGPISQITALDHDNDALPGISLVTRGSDELSPSGEPYDLPPVTVNLNARATLLELALQVRAVVHATLTNCDAFSGGIESGAVEARALGCRAQKDDKSPELACTADQVTFVDNNLPNWTFVGGRFRALRVEPGASCTTVRSVWKD